MQCRIRDREPTPSSVQHSYLLPHNSPSDLLYDDPAASATDIRLAVQRSGSIIRHMNEVTQR